MTNYIENKKYHNSNILSMDRRLQDVIRVGGGNIYLRLNCFLRFIDFFENKITLL